MKTSEKSLFRNEAYLFGFFFLSVDVADARAAALMLRERVLLNARQVERVPLWRNGSRACWVVEATRYKVGIEFKWIAVGPCIPDPPDKTNQINKQHHILLSNLPEIDLSV